MNAEIAFEVHAGLGESPVWDERDGSVVFVDIEGKSVHRFRPGRGEHSSFLCEVPVGAVGLRRDGGLVLALVDHFALCEADGSSMRAFGSLVTDVGRVRFNDGEVDPWGRFVAGTMDWQQAEPLGSLYRLSDDGEVCKVIEGVTISNGLAWAADRRKLFYVDTPTRRIDVFDVDPETGVLSGRRTHLEIDRACGDPDGLALDIEGCIWLACYKGSQVRRYTPDGRLDRVVRLPVTHVTSVAFGGARLDELYITTAAGSHADGAGRVEHHGGDLFVAEPGVQGHLPNRFGRPVTA